MVINNDFLLLAASTSSRRRPRSRSTSTESQQEDRQPSQQSASLESTSSAPPAAAAAEPDVATVADPPVDPSPDAMVEENQPLRRSKRKCPKISAQDDDFIYGSDNENDDEDEEEDDDDVNEEDGESFSGSVTDVFPLESIDTTRPVADCAGYYQFEVKPYHMVKSRLGRKVFQCDICSGVYRHTFSLKRHYIRNHINYKYVSKTDRLNCNINYCDADNISVASSALDKDPSPASLSDGDEQDAGSSKTLSSSSSLVEEIQGELGANTKPPSLLIDAGDKIQEETADSERVQDTGKESDSAGKVGSVGGTKRHQEPDKSDLGDGQNRSGETTENQPSASVTDGSKLREQGDASSGDSSRVPPGSTASTPPKSTVPSGDSNAVGKLATSSVEDKTATERCNQKSAVQDENGAEGEAVMPSAKTEIAKEADETSNENNTSDTEAKSAGETDREKLEPAAADSPQNLPTDNDPTVAASSVDCGSSLKDVAPKDLPRSDGPDPEPAKDEMQAAQPLKPGCPMRGVFRCNICEVLFDTVPELKVHLQHHPDVPSAKKFACNQCDMKFAHKQNLMRHQAVHSGRLFCSFFLCNLASTGSGRVARFVSCISKQMAMLVKKNKHTTFLSCHNLKQITLLSCHKQTTLLSCHKQTTLLSCNEQTTLLSCRKQTTLLSCHKQTTLLSCYMSKPPYCPVTSKPP